ncbi:TetR/AcrR family transcriptional regulator C-terminal ligand-binding domain-containing protein [Trujillonella humicola]|uniref:TetR/AcrR family transcriptional regulator C-terminal ligand-binding domain-containing protein n=1 Tax=Trujillonella humicola TaxID=3383699 RepID=UPI0039063BE6
MEVRYSWESPITREVLQAVLGALADYGYSGLTAAEIHARTGVAGELLEAADLHELVIAALERVRAFSPPKPTGSLRGDLRALLQPWRGGLSPDERAIAAVLSAAEWDSSLKRAVHAAFDQPLAEVIGGLLARAAAAGQAPAAAVHTLNWLLRSLAVDRLRASHPRTQVDIDHLVDYLVAGLACATRTECPASTGANGG